MVFIKNLRTLPSRTFSSIRKNLSASSNRDQGFFGVPAGAGGPNFPPVFFKIGGGEGGGGVESIQLVALRVSSRLEQVLDRGSNRFISPQELVDRYNGQFADGIREGNIDSVSGAVLNEALKIMRFRKVIEEKDGGLRIFNQVARINEVASQLQIKLGGITNLHDLIGTLAKGLKELPETTDIYLYDQVSGEMLKTATTSEADYSSNYQNWASVKEQGIFDIVIHSENYRLSEPKLVDEVKGTGFRITRQVRDHGPIFFEDYGKYTRVFKDPDEVRFQRGKDEQNRVVLVTKRHAWKTKKQEGGNPLLYSKNCGTMEVDKAWDSLDQVIASAIGRIVKDNAVKKVWNTESVELDQMLAAGPSLVRLAWVEVAPAPSTSKVPGLNEAGREKWVDRNEMAISRFYDKFTRTFAFICRLSRAYQLSVIEGIDRIVEDLKKRTLSGQQIKIVDAGAGSAYFLERLMLKGKAEKLNLKATAIDLSKVACAITKQACARFGDSVRVTKGNIARMTRFLEDLDPLEPASQDLVLINYVIQYVPIEEVLRETNKILKPGGRILLTNFKPKASMRWDEFWTNVRASLECGKNKKFGHGRLYELARYFLLFFRHALGIIQFARNIDRDVRSGVIPENPNEDQLKGLLAKYGFEVLLLEDTHHYAAYRLYAQKISELDRIPQA